MSQPNLPDITPNISLTREEAINLLLSSIAMQELGLAHIINAEGEKLQYALGTLTNNNLATPPTFDQLIQLNKSVQSTLKSASEAEMLLKGKLESVMEMPTMIGPTGPTGPTGPCGNSSPNNALFSTNNFVLTTTGTQDIPLNNIFINGTNITHTNLSTTINLLGNSIYYISYSGCIDFPGNVNISGVAGASFKLNGIDITGTAISSRVNLNNISTNTFVPLSASSIISVTNPSPLVFNAGQINSSNTNLGNAIFNVSIFKIA